ncbi:macrophage mannose receptor 1 [Aphelenchoides avenae]|nr:macrophage mannose receptor 1 [Aphelenchus avenae]
MQKPLVGTYGWWTVARAKCQSYGGDLASITNEELNDEISAWTGQMFLGAFWIGLTTSDTTEELMWTDGSPVNYTNWADDYSHDYLNLITYLGVDGKWHDDNTEDAVAYICEKAPEK